MSEPVTPIGWNDPAARRLLRNMFDAADSDGFDGTEDAAGAFVRADTFARARFVGVYARACLDRHDSYIMFAGDLIRTGPAGTNDNDIRAVLITRGGPRAD